MVWVGNGTPHARHPSNGAAGYHRETISSHALTPQPGIGTGSVAQPDGRGANLCGSNTRMWSWPVDSRSNARLSSGDLVLVREASKDLLSADPVLGEVDLQWPDVRLSRWQLA